MIATREWVKDLLNKCFKKQQEKIDDNLKAYNTSTQQHTDLEFRFATDGEGNYGYLKGDDTFTPFKSGDNSGGDGYYIGDITTEDFKGETIQLLDSEQNHISDITFSDEGNAKLFVPSDGTYYLSKNNKLKPMVISALQYVFNNFPRYFFSITKPNDYLEYIKENIPRNNNYNRITKNNSSLILQDYGSVSYNANLHPSIYIENLDITNISNIIVSSTRSSTSGWTYVYITKTSIPELTIDPVGCPAYIRYDTQELSSKVLNVSSFTGEYNIAITHAANANSWNTLTIREWYWE